jgi:truncated hemoglobin YjbI
MKSIFSFLSKLNRVDQPSTALPKSRRLARRPVVISLLLIMLVSIFAQDADARRSRRKKRRSKTKRAKIINEPKLYERIGGAKALSEIVDEWLKLSFTDSRTSAVFSSISSQPDKVARLKKQINARLCELTDGPCAAGDIDPKKEPEGMLIADEVFLYHAENLFKAMQSYGISEREKNEMLGSLGAYRADLIPEVIANSTQSAGN